MNLDFEMGFQEAEQAVLGWNPLHLRTILLMSSVSAFSIFFLILGLIDFLIDIIYPLLRGEPAMDFMLRLFGHAKDYNRPI